MNDEIEPINDSDSPSGADSNPDSEIRAENAETSENKAEEPEESNRPEPIEAESPSQRENTRPIDVTAAENYPTERKPGSSDSDVPSRPSKEKRRPSSRFNPLASIQTIILTGVIMATLLTLWTPGSLFSNNLLRKMLADMEAEKSSPVTVPNATIARLPHIGLVAGHWGNDSGAVCPNGTTEVDLNLRIANLTREYLISEGYDVDLLKERDEKLTLYSAAVLVSIHNDSCMYIGQHATGFKVASALSDSYPEKSAKLTACLIDRYQKATGLNFHANTITKDMTDYHTFNEIHSNTTAAIIETGFMNMDYEILTEHTDQIARGVADGILCFLRNETIEIKIDPPAESETPTPTSE